MEGEQVTTTSESAGLDMDAAVADIASSMNFEEPEEKTPAPDAEKAAGAESPATEGDDSSARDPAASSPKEGEASSAAPAAAPTAVAPDTWTKEAQAEWEKLSPTVQAEVRKREEDIARYVGETKPRLELAAGLEKLLEPHMPIFQQYNVNPWNYMQNLMNAHRALLFGNPEQKVHVAFALLKDAGIDPGKLAGQDPRQAITPPNQEVQALRARIAQLEGGMQQVASSFASQRTAEQQHQVAAFAEDPKHPYFFEVSEDVATLLESKVCKTLDEAYERAVWGNPLVRAKEISRLETERKQAAETERLNKLKESRKAAGVNVRGRGQGNGAVPTADWESDLGNILKDIRTA